MSGGKPCCPTFVSFGYQIWRNLNWIAHSNKKMQEPELRGAIQVLALKLYQIEKFLSTHLIQMCRANFLLWFFYLEFTAHVKFCPLTDLSHYCQILKDEILFTPYNIQFERSSPSGDLALTILRGALQENIDNVDPEIQIRLLDGDGYIQ